MQYKSLCAFCFLFRPFHLFHGINPMAGGPIVCHILFSLGPCYFHTSNGKRERRGKRLGWRWGIYIQKCNKKLGGGGKKKIYIFFFKGKKNHKGRQIILLLELPSFISLSQRGPSLAPNKWLILFLTLQLPNLFIRSVIFQRFICTNGKCLFAGQQSTFSPNIPGILREWKNTINPIKAFDKKKQPWRKDQIHLSPFHWI